MNPLTKPPQYALSPVAEEAPASAAADHAAARDRKRAGPRPADRPCARAGARSSASSPVSPCEGTGLEEINREIARARLSQISLARIDVNNLKSCERQPGPPR